MPRKRKRSVRAKDAADAAAAATAAAGAATVAATARALAAAQAVAASVSPEQQPPRSRRVFPRGVPLISTPPQVRRLQPRDLIESRSKWRCPPLSLYKKCPCCSRYGGPFSRRQANAEAIARGSAPPQPYAPRDAAAARRELDAAHRGDDDVRAVQQQQLAVPPADPERAAPTAVRADGGSADGARQPAAAGARARAKPASSTRGVLPAACCVSAARLLLAASAS